MANKWLKQLRAYDDTVDYEYDSFAPENCLYTPSPYFNWIFANKSNGIPKNASILFFSEQKAGKSLSCYSVILEMQKRDPEGIAIYFNTELRGQLQHDVFPAIDKERMIIYDTRDPKEIFDRIETDIKAMVQDGMPLRILVIDSLTKIMGIKRKDADSVEQHLRGDHALTIQTGMDKLIPFCKQNKIMLACTSQMRSNQEATAHGPKEKMAESWDVKHAFEYFVSLKRAGAAEDKADLEGKTFEEDSKDARGNQLLTGHKIYVKMEANSIGPQGRSGVFTMDYKDGIINQHEEIFFLGKNSGVIATESNNRVFVYGGKKYVGKKEMSLAIKEDPKLAQEILSEVIQLDAKKEG